MTRNTYESPQIGSAGAQAVFSGWQRGLLLASFLILVVFRIPRAWLHGRFIDEEATVFLAYAWHHPWLDALFRPFAGYWNLGANATTLLVARLVQNVGVPLEMAPYFTMIFALSVQALPAILLLTGRASWLESPKTIVLALLLLAIAPGTEEVFFNVLHIQFHLALCVALILALDPPCRTHVRAGYTAILFLAPLCGPVALVFLPLFALRALTDRDRDRLEQLLIFGLGGAVQMLLFYGSNPMRGHLLHPNTIAAVMFVRLIAMPTLGFGKASKIADSILRSKLVGGVGWWWSAGAAALFFAFLLWLALRRRDGAVWLLLSSMAMAIASFGFGMIMVVREAAFDLDSERYTFVPLVLLCFAIIVMAMRAGSKARWFCMLFLLLTIITGVSRYPRPLPRLGQGPSWAAQVAVWRQDHNYRLAVWPRRWRADLSDNAQSCPPIGPDPARTNAPRYCDAGWVAPFYRRRRALNDTRIDSWR